ncbi:MAG: helix-turn-helix transcriptional regulator [Vicinamibacterales bacterium]
MGAATRLHHHPLDPRTHRPGDADRGRRALPALYRLEAQELIEGSWGTSENNRRARFYKLTPAGRRRLLADADTWDRYAGAVGQILGASSGPEPVKR